MPLQHLRSIDDPRIAPYRNLSRVNLTRHSGLFIVEGRLLVERLVASPYEVESVLVEAHRVDELPAGLQDETVYVVPSGLIQQIIGFKFHRGILACGRRSATARLPAPTPTSLDDPLRWLICVDVHDPTNLGGILRCGAAFGVDAVLVNRRTADPFSRRVLRVSMGASLFLPIYTLQDPVAELSSLSQDWQVELVASVLDRDAERLERVTSPRRWALLLGNEGYGLPESIVDLCQRRVTIPMAEPTDSLNAAVAAGVLLYHFTRVGS